jgi:VWFA-related protein
MLWRWIAVLGVVSSVWLSVAQGQQQGQAGASAATYSTENEISTRGTTTAIKVQVNLVQVRVVVRDASGKLVPGLKQKDFQVLDNGKQQRISAFSVETAETLGQSGVARVEGKAVGTETGKGAEGEAGAEVGNAPAIPKRFVALVFDDLNMKAADAMAVRAATKKLFANLTPSDRVAIYSTTGNVQQDFTGDAETLRKTLAAIIPHPAKGEGQYECPNITYYQADLIVNKHDQEAINTALTDASVNGCPTDIEAVANRILRAGDLQTRDNYQSLDSIVRRLTDMAGQRVLVYVSPGFILGDAVMPDSGELIERAMRAGVVVNTIDARGLYTADMMPDIAAPPQAAPYKDNNVSVADYQAMEGMYRMQAQFESGGVLAGMAASTGGTYFHNRNDLDVGMCQALEAPSVSYVLGFKPQNPMVDGKFHKLKVMVANGKKYQIQARNGYYASKLLVDEPEEMAEQGVREALFSQDEIVGVPVKVTAKFSKANATLAQLTVLTRLDIRGLRFRKADGRSYNDVVLETAVFDANGQFVDGERKEIALKLKDSTLERMSQTGLTIKTVFTVKPGTYRVRSVVRGSEGDQLTARNLMTVIPAKQPNESGKKVSGQNLQWAPPKVDAHLKSLSMIPPCNLSEVLDHTAANSLVLTSNLEKITAQEHIEYVMLDRSGMVEEFDSGWFDYVYSIEQQKGGSVSREYRTPAKGGHAFRESGMDIGQAAIASIFQPDLQTDYEMKCEGMDERNGQLDWVVHFQQRKDRPSHTAKFSVDNVAYPAMLKGRAWISKDNYQVVHLEANLMGDLPQIGLQELAFSVNYELVPTPSVNLGIWLPNSTVTYWNFDAHRVILAHTFANFQFFTVETKETIQEPKEP